jgi:alpha-tubulin suppressor-like RCC1 family protein
MTKALAGLVLLVACGTEPAAPPPPVASVEVTPAAAGVVLGHTLQLTARVRDAAGKELVDRPLTWTSSAPTQGAVSPTGLVTGLALGDSVVIMATSEGKSGNTILAVVIDLAGEWNFTEQIVATIQNLVGELVTVTCNDTGSYQFTQGGADIAGTKAHVGTCLGRLTSNENSEMWPFPIAGHLTSTHIGFVIVANGCRYDGDVTGPPAPRLRGTHSCPNESGSWEATPGGAPVASVAVRWDLQTVVGGAVQLAAVPRDAAGHVLSRAVTWSSDKPSVAAVADDGLVTTLTAGSARITATSEAMSGSAAVTADVVSFESVSAGVYHSCAITPTGAAYCWGWGGNGELGIGFRPTGAPPEIAPLASAESPLAVAGGHTFAFVAAGSRHSCGITSTGEAYCWGDNSLGQLGDGSTTASLVPVRVTGGHQFASVTVGIFHSCGVTTGNEVYCWGDNRLGQLGDGSQSPSASPVPVAANVLFRAVRAGLHHNCGVTTANQAYCWGFDLFGQVGNGTATLAVTSPVEVVGGHSFVAVAAGHVHSCAIALDGAAYCWGEGSLLGDGSGLSRLAPVQVAGGPFATAEGALAAGQEHSCALTPTGAAYCWGHNDLGELGDRSTIDRSTPVQVSGGLNFAAISVGVFHTCGATPPPAAVAFCWGDDGNGQLGADPPESCVSRLNGKTLPCATAPLRVIGQPGAAPASSLRVEGRVQRAAGEPPGLRLPAPSLRLPRAFKP